MNDQLLTRRHRPKLAWMVITVTAITITAVITVVSGTSSSGKPVTPDGRRPGTCVGIYAIGAPGSYSGVAALSARTGVRPDVVVYYSGWPERFQVQFAATAVRHGAVPLVQIDPTGASIDAIAAGRYDAYLRSYASAVKAFGSEVILSFGHEMNGYWYSWGYRHTSPAVFVAAWRHIVTVFRQQGAGNVTWLWTVNIIDKRGGIPAPAPWWPGSAYVTWVGMDGYYARPSLTFASLFGPTIKAVRALTLDPILIAETAVAPAAGQPAKIADLVAGVRAYGLLGFIWFNATGHLDWRLSGPAAFAAFHRGAKSLQRRSP